MSSFVPTPRPTSPATLGAAELGQAEQVNASKGTPPEVSTRERWMMREARQKKEPSRNGRHWSRPLCEEGC